MRARPSRELGDIVIATGVARRQAREAGHSYNTELRVLALHGLLHLLGYDHHDDRGPRPDGARGSASRPEGRPAPGPDRTIMTPLLLFLLAIAAVYVGTIETAFSALMRLSLRLMAERGGRDDRLGFYLEDPIQLFVPARLLLGHHLLARHHVHRDPDRGRRAPVDRDAHAVRGDLHPRLRARAADAHRPPQPGARARDSPAPVRFRGAVPPPADGRPRAADCRRGPARSRRGHERQRGAGGSPGAARRSRPRDRPPTRG